MKKYFSNNYISNYLQISYYTYPFQHIVIDNLLSDKYYNHISNTFLDMFNGVKRYKDTEGATNDYEGYIVGIKKEYISDGYDFFVSKYLRSYVSDVFDININKYVALSAHLHKGPAKPGFIHRDANICSFYPEKDQDIVVNNAIYTDDSASKQLGTIKTMRSVAMLYYLNNPSIETGGTGIYDNYNGKLIKNIQPVNNRLFIFEINDKSYHSFMGSDFDRSAIVCWYHSSPAYLINKYWKQYSKMKKNNQNFIEVWSSNPEGGYWKIEKDPEYPKYFGNIPKT